MSDAPIRGPQPDQLSAVSRPQAKPVTGTPKTSSTNPTFHALLERLQEHASELEKTSRTLDRPELLAGAVDSARASLEDAQSLGDRLMEAYRATQQRHLPPGEVPTEEKPR